MPSENNGIHILFVDDESNLLLAIKRLLKRRGYTVTSVNGSNEAIKLIKKHHDKYDVIITDYWMPGMNGIELALAAGKLLVDTPVILLTGKIDPFDKNQINEAGIAGVVNKPCKIEELDFIIQKVINENSK